MLLLPLGYAIAIGPPDLTAQLLSNRDALLPTQRYAAPRGIGGWLSPVNFRGIHPRRVSCYAFFKGWLLLSLPPRCLRLTTPFCLTLSQHFGALTPVWVVPLSALGAYPLGPFPGVYGAGGFGV